MLLLYLVLICVLTILVCILLWRVGLPRSTLTNLINIPGYNVLDMIVVVAKVAVSAVTFVTISIAQLWMSDYVAYLYFWRIAYYIACSYHPPKSNYIASEFCTELNKILNQINLTATSSDAIITVADDFNQLNTSFLEIDHGLVQIVNSVTHRKKCIGPCLYQQCKQASGFFRILLRGGGNCRRHWGARRRRRWGGLGMGRGYPTPHWKGV